MQAIGASTGIVIGRAIIRDLYERDRAAAMIGLVTTAMVIAPMIAPLIGGILDTAFGWEAIFMFIALFTGAVLLWAVFVLPETRPASVAQTPAMLLQDCARAARQARNSTATCWPARSARRRSSPSSAAARMWW